MRAVVGVPWRALIGGSMNSTMVLEQLEFWFGSTPTLTPPPPHQGNLPFSGRTSGYVPLGRGRNMLTSVLKFTVFCYRLDARNDGSGVSRASTREQNACKAEHVMCREA